MSGLRQLKSNQNRLNPDAELFFNNFYTGWIMFTEGADRFAGQLRGNKECSFSGVTKSGSLEEGGEKRCSECALDRALAF